LVLSVAEAAEMLGISRTLAYELVARDELPALRLGGRIVILLKPLRRLLDGRPMERVPDEGEEVAWPTPASPSTEAS
jgi:excisionase family DNA binding protein